MALHLLPVDASPSSSDIPKEPSAPFKKRPSKSQVKTACVNCKKAHLACDLSRPCKRCVHSGKEDTCRDIQHKKRGRPKLRDKKISTSTLFALQAMFQHLTPTPAAVQQMAHLSATAPSIPSLAGPTTSCSMMTIFLSMDLCCARVSDESLDFLGLYPQEFSHRSLYDFLSPTHVDTLANIHRSLLVHGSSLAGKDARIPPSTPRANAPVFAQPLAHQLLEMANGSITINQELSFKTTQNQHQPAQARFYLGGGLGANLFEPSTLQLLYIVCILSKSEDVTSPVAGATTTTKSSSALAAGSPGTLLSDDDMQQITVPSTSLPWSSSTGANHHNGSSSDASGAGLMSPLSQVMDHRASLSPTFSLDMGSDSPPAALPPLHSSSTTNMSTTTAHDDALSIITSFASAPTSAMVPVSLSPANPPPLLHHHHHQQQQQHNQPLRQGSNMSMPSPVLPTMAMLDTYSIDEPSHRASFSMVTDENQASHPLHQQQHPLANMSYAQQHAPSLLDNIVGPPTSSSSASSMSSSPSSTPTTSTSPAVSSITTKPISLHAPSITSQIHVPQQPPKRMATAPTLLSHAPVHSSMPHHHHHQPHHHHQAPTLATNNPPATGASTSILSPYHLYYQTISSSRMSSEARAHNGHTAPWTSTSRTDPPSSSLYQPATVSYYQAASSVTRSCKRLDTMNYKRSTSSNMYP
ncbi:hypothetical protein BC940DRAFT_331964 [Gongronella butleri]|nr:hypothetical protein BC940DRAFT_331964 [Gongronella butleri]